MPDVFPLSSAQQQQLEMYQDLMRHMNQRLNLVSRASIDHFWQRHILHCLALSTRQFPAGATVVDWGTGGGLPAIPLAICFPAVTFYAVDSIGKKCRAVAEMVEALNLPNVHVWNGRAEQWPGKAHYAVSRATAPLLRLWTWFLHARTNTVPPASAEMWPSGLHCLKGGNLSEEIKRLRRQYPNTVVTLTPLSEVLGGEYFATKYLVSVVEEGKA